MGLREAAAKPYLAFERKFFNYFLGDIQPTEAEVKGVRRLMGGAAVFMSGLAIVAGGREIYQSTHTSRFDKLAARYQMDKYSPQEVSAFSSLAYLSPDRVRVENDSQRQVLGREIQQDLAVSSLAGFRQGLDNKGVAVDMWDLSQELIPADTLEALQREGFVFTGEDPVVCDAPAPNGDHGYRPLDYSNHPPQDFQVRTTMVGGHEQTVVPLGTEEMPSMADPFYYEYHKFDNVRWGWGIDQIGYLACVDLYPHWVYPPNNSTYPPNQELQISLW